MFITAPNSDVGLNINTPPNKEVFLNFGDFDNISGGVIRYKNASDSFHFRTSGSDALNINASGDVDIFGKVGVGVELPKAKLHVDGDTILSGNAIITGRILVGTGVLSPDAQLHVRSTDEVILKLEADTDDTNEDHNPLIQFIQDGGSISSNFGFNGATNTKFTNAIADSFYIENKSSNSSSQNIQFATNNKAQVTITDDDKVGIGTHDPLAKLHVSGNTILSGVLTVTGDIDSPSITSLNTATGDLRNNLLIVSGLIVSNDADLTALNTATGVLNTNVIGLQTATGLLVQKSETGVLLTSGEIQTNIDTAIANLVDSAPGTLNTLNELAAALGDDANFSTTTATSLGNLSTATGVLNTNVLGLQTATGSLKSDISSNDSDIASLQTATGSLKSDISSNDSDISNLQAVTGSFAQTGSSTFGFLNVTGDVGVGTTNPSAKLHVSGDTLLSGNLTVTGNITVSGSILPLNDVVSDIGSPSKRFKDLYLSGDSIFLGETKLFISGDEIQTRRNDVIRRVPLRDNLNQTQNLIVTGNSVFGKTSLSANSFVTETGDFTLGLNHRGATVLLQNPAAMPITCPSALPGHVTTFIAETINTVSFATGVGMSGLNSFGGASDMAGIFAQAQIIYKSSSGAFLGGNIV